MDFKPSMEEVAAGVDAMQQDQSRRNIENHNLMQEARQLLLDANLDVSKVNLICYKIVIMAQSIEEMKEMMKDLSDSFVKKDDFNLVRKIVFGVVAIILTGTLIAIMTTIIPTFHTS